MPGNAQVYVLPGTVGDWKEQTALKSPEEVKPLLAKSVICRRRH